MGGEAEDSQEAAAVSGDVDALSISGGALDPAVSEHEAGDEAAGSEEGDEGAASEAEPALDDEDDEDLGFESLPPDLDLGDNEEEEEGPGPVAEGTAYTSGSLDGEALVAGSSSSWRRSMERPSTAKSTASSTTSRR